MSRLPPTLLSLVTDRPAARRADKCEKAEPYPGAPEAYMCGVSDEDNPETGFACMSLEVEADETGKIAFAKTDVPNETPTMADDEEEELLDANGGSSRRLLGRRSDRTALRSRSLRTTSTIGYSAVK